MARGVQIGPKITADFETWMESLGEDVGTLEDMMEKAFRAGWHRGWERCRDETDNGDFPD